MLRRAPDRAAARAARGAAPRRVTGSNENLPRELVPLLVLLTLFWGFNWPMMKLALAEMTPTHFRSLCLLSGAVGVFAIAAASGQRIAVPQGQWPRLVLISVLNFTAWNALIAYAVPMMSSGRAAILAYTMPVWAVFFGLFVLHERLTPRRAVGLLLGMAGMALLLWSEIAALERSPLGAMLIVAAAILWGLGTVIMKRWPVSLPASSLTAWQMAIGVIPILTYAVLFADGSFDLTGLSRPALAGVIYNMVISFIFCQWAWIKIALVAPVGVSTVGTLLVPVVGVFSGMLVLGERPHWQDYAALVLVGLAIASVLLPERRPALTPPAA
jgi:drug/metabolite transporter (DMT)-like permease